MLNDSAENGLAVNNPWNGSYEDGTVARPGRKYPYSYVLQTEGDGPGPVHWAVLGQGGGPSADKVFVEGSAPSADEARAVVGRLDPADVESGVVTPGADGAGAGPAL